MTEKMFGALPPPDDYSLTISERDDLGCICIKSSVPGLTLYGPSLDKLLADVPAAIARLRRDNGDERRGLRTGEKHG
jgi:hypothetical protein